MALLRLRYEADCLTVQHTKQSLKHQLSSNLDRSYPYRASGLVPGREYALAVAADATGSTRPNPADCER